MKKFLNALKKTAKVVLFISFILLTIPIIVINGIIFLAETLLALIPALLLTGLSFLK